MPGDIKLISVEEFCAMQPPELRSRGIQINLGFADEVRPTGSTLNLATISGSGIDATYWNALGAPRLIELSAVSNVVIESNFIVDEDQNSFFKNLVSAAVEISSSPTDTSLFSGELAATNFQTLHHMMLGTEGFDSFDMLYDQLRVA